MSKLVLGAVGAAGAALIAWALVRDSDDANDDDDDEPRYDHLTPSELEELAEDVRAPRHGGNRRG